MHKGQNNQHYDAPEQGLAVGWTFVRKKEGNKVKLLLLSLLCRLHYNKIIINFHKDYIHKSYDHKFALKYV